MSDTLRKVISGKKLGDLLQPPAPMSTRSKRAAAVAVEPDSNISSTVLTLDSSDANPPTSQGVPRYSGDHNDDSIQDPPLDDNAGPDRAQEVGLVSLEAQPSPSSGRVIRHSRTSSGPGGLPPMPQSEPAPAHSQDCVRSNQHIFSEASSSVPAGQRQSAHLSSRRMSSVQQDWENEGQPRASRDHRSSSLNRPRVSFGEYRSGQISHDYVLPEYDRGFDFTRDEFDSAAMPHNHYFQHRPRQPSMHKSPLFKRGDFPEFATADVAKDIRVFERSLRRCNVFNKSDILEAAIVTFPQKLVNEYIASLRDDEEESYEALKIYVIKHSKTFFACHTADQFISPKRTGQAIFDRAKQIIDEPRDELYKYVISTLCTPPVKDRIRHHFRYGVEAFEVAVEGFVDDYRRGGVPQPQGQKHPNTQHHHPKQKQTQSFPSRSQQDPQQFWPSHPPARPWVPHPLAPQWDPQSSAQPWAPQNQQFQISAPPQMNSGPGRRRYDGPRKLRDGLCFNHYTYGDRAYSCEEGGCRMTGRVAPRPAPKNG